jgi:integrase
MREAQQLLNASRDMRNGARFVVALTLGLRKGEALGLKWRDIDFRQRTLTIRRTVQRLNWQHGCPPSEPCGRRYAGHCPHRHSGGTVPAEVKSGAGKRTIGLPLPLIEVLEAHRAHQDQERKRAANLWLDEDWVFANRLGGPVHPRIDHDAWKNLLKKAGVRDARLHDARHTAATMLLLLGVPDRAVMDVMGWAQISMTRRYQHITTELTTMIADQVGGLYWSADSPPDSDRNNSPAGKSSTA